MHIPAIDWTPFPFQRKAAEDIWAAIDEGYAGIVLTAPCRSGKTKVAELLIYEALARGWPVSFYTHRISLTKQVIARLATDAGIAVGVRARGWTADLGEMVQIASLWTEASKVLRRTERQIHPSKLVIIDELRLQTGPTALRIFDQHIKQGAHLVGMDGTPVDIPVNYFQKQIVATNNTELRALKQHVPCYHYGFEEPDLRHVKRMRDGSFSPSELSKAMHIYHIFGSVYGHWHELNPEHKPSILFAPGCAESLWFAHELAKEHVAAAHIDGGQVYFNEACKAYAGKTFKGPSGLEMRQEAFDMSRDGDLPIITNRFVARDSLDLPWLQYCIGATAWGSLASYVQSGSRILTAYPGKGKCFFLDHGGSWHRHGSLNEDRLWPLGCTAGELADVRKQEHISGEKEEATCCPRCGAIRGAAFRHTGICQACGLQYSQSIRPVIQKDGKLRLVEGSVYKKRRKYLNADLVQKWRKYYFIARKKHMTFAQIEGWFAKHNEWRYPPRTLPNMPKKAADWARHVSDVPAEGLYNEHTAPYMQENPSPQGNLPGHEW